MKISFDIGTEDMVAFNSYYYDTDPAVRKQLRRLRIFYPILCLIIGASLSFNKGDWNWSGLIIFGAIALLWTIFSPMYGKGRWLKKVRKELVKPENSAWFGAREMVADDEKFWTVSEKSEETVMWDGIIKIGETPDHFFLFQTPRQAFVVPKQQITPAEVEELRSLFAKHIVVNTSEIKNKK